MIRAMVWTLVFAGLLTGGGRYVWLRSRAVARQARTLGVELAQAEALVGVVGSAAAELEQQRRSAGEHPDTAPRPEPAVFRNPFVVAAERTDVREALARQRRERRAAHRPGWARPVD